MRKQFVNISRVYGAHSAEILRLEGIAMAEMPSLENVFMTVEDGKIVELGAMDHLPESSCEHVDLKRAAVLPSYCDSHTHIVFAEPREHEFEMKIKGRTYEEIAANGGGILNSAAKLQSMSEEELFHKSQIRLDQLIHMGTGAIEIKSGYGLSIEAELKMLKVIRRLRENNKLPIRSSFLGAHAIPKEYKADSDQYISSVVIPAMEMAHKDGLVDFVDIFIENNYFTKNQAHHILDHADLLGLPSKLHVNQLSNSGALQLAVDRKALSADHLEEMTEIEINYLKNNRTIGTILPSCSFFLRIPYAPARAMIDAGLGIALASDYNPGSTPSGNMNFVLSLACIQQRLLPAEAFNAATINGAYAMDLSHEVGSITKGKTANFMVSRQINSLASIPYSFGRNLIDEVYLNGEKV